MNPDSLKLYLIVEPECCGGVEGMVNTAIAAAQNGVTMVQLRSDIASKRELFEAALLLKQALDQFRVPLIINDYADIALATDAAGVHVGQSDLPASAARKILGAEKIIGLSVSNRAQLEKVPWNDVDYLGLGPVFPTKSKADAAPDIGIELLKTFCELKKKPAVAIGGIHVGNVEEVLKTGVEGVCVISAICSERDPAVASFRLRNVIERFRHDEVSSIFSS